MPAGRGRERVAAFSPDVHYILTVERGWTAEQYERWLIRSLGVLLRNDRQKEG